MQKIMTITVVCILFPVFFGCDLILSGPLPGEGSTLTGSVTLDKLSPKVGESITAAYIPGNGIGEQTWQWFRIEDTETEDLIQSATGNTYTATADDEGKKIRVQLSFAGRIGSVSATTNTVARASDPDDPGDPGDPGDPIDPDDPGDPIDPECGCAGIEGDCDCEVCNCEVCASPPPPDNTAPALSAGSVNRTSDTAATINFTTNEAGTAYYSVVAVDAAEPTSAAVRAGTSLGAVSSGAVNGRSVTLTTGQKYIYVVVQDSSGNTSAPLKIPAPAYDYSNVYANAIIGVWQTGAEYWEFRTDGTGGRASTQAGPFPDNFSFTYFDSSLLYSESTYPALPSLLIIEGSPVTVTCYHYAFSGNQMTLTQFQPVESTSAGAFEDVDTPPITLTLVRAGSSTVLNLTNMLIGEWQATWTNVSNGTWSFRYRANGTVKVYHDRAQHQFENLYALRGNTLVMFGNWRFANPTIGDITSPGNNQLVITERQINPAPFVYTYTKVDFAAWKP